MLSVMCFLCMVFNSDLRLELLSVLPKQDNTSSRGILITSPTVHEQVRYFSWNFDMVVDGSNEVFITITSSMV